MSVIELLKQKKKMKRKKEIKRKTTELQFNKQPSNKALKSLPNIILGSGD